MFNFRTDLAVERRDLYQKANNLEEQINGIESEKEEIFNKIIKRNSTIRHNISIKGRKMKYFF